MNVSGSNAPAVYGGGSGGLGQGMNAPAVYGDRSVGLSQEMNAPAVTTTGLAILGSCCFKRYYSRTSSFLAIDYLLTPYISSLSILTKTMRKRIPCGRNTKN